MDELRAKQTLAYETAVGASKRIGPPLRGQISRDELGQIILSFEPPARLEADEQWIVALLRSGISPEDILEIWDKKDEVSRDLKTRLADGSS